MIDIEVFDKEFGWTSEKTFSAAEIVALQLSGNTDDIISSMNPDSFCVSDKKQLAFASDKLRKFWNLDKEDEFTHLLRECDAQYYVECSASVAKAFKRIGAIPVPNYMIKYLLRNEDVIPAQDSIRFMHQEQSPDHSAWRTIFLLNSIKQWDAVYDFLSPLDTFTINSRQDAVKVIQSLYDQTSESMVYEQFPRWREAVRTARYNLKDHKNEGLTELELGLLYRYSKDYLGNYKELTLQDIPTNYLETITDEYGVRYSNTQKRLIGVSIRKSFSCNDYVVPATVESIDDNAMMCLSTLKHITLPNSLRRIGCNQFLDSALEELSIPESVDFIIDGCMCEGCKSLKSVVFNNHQEYLSIATFNGCGALESVRLPKGLVGLSDNVFSGTSNLKSLDIEGVRWIGGECFLDCGLPLLKLTPSIEEVTEDAFNGMGKHSVHLYKMPTPYLFAGDREFGFDAHDTAELFTACWIHDLLGLYGIIRLLQDKRVRNYQLESTKKELSDYLKWMCDHIVDELDDETIQYCAYTMEPSTFSPLYFACIIATKISEEDLVFDAPLCIKYGLEFKQHLPTLYALVDEHGSHEAIDNFIQTIGEVSSIQKDSMLSSELEVASTLSFGDRTIVRMKSQFGYTSSSPSITVSNSLIAEFINVVKSFSLSK